jgi:hypothetical protein
MLFEMFLASMSTTLANRKQQNSIRMGRGEKGGKTNLTNSSYSGNLMMI